jgi:hypothetical protein
VVVQLAHGALQGLLHVAQGLHELQAPQVPQELHESVTMQGSATTTVCCGRQRPHQESRQHWQPVAPINNIPNIINASNFFMVGLLPVSV